MISLDLTRTPAGDTKKLYLMKGRSVSICHHCQKSLNRKSLLRCNECRHDFCANCLDACRCYTEGGFRIGSKRKAQQQVKSPLAVVAGGGLQKSHLRDQN